MYRLKHLLVFCTSASLLLAASFGTSAPKDFSACDSYKGTGTGYGVCRAGIAVGCDDDTGNPGACMNIEEQFLAVTGQDAPWVIPADACPCNFGSVEYTQGPWADDFDVLHCDAQGDVVSIYDEDMQETRLEAGNLDAQTGSYCLITVDGELQTYNATTDLQHGNCKDQLNSYPDGYWDILYNEPFANQLDFTQINNCNS